MKTLRIFRRDLTVSLRQFITLWIMLVPVALAWVISAVTPGIVDSPVRIAMLRDENPAQVAYLNQYLQVEIFDTLAQLTRRVMERDDVPAIIPDGAGGYAILAQGNEPESIITGVKMFKACQEAGIRPDLTKVAFHSFGRTAPALKVTLTASLIVLVTILSGMLIANNIVEEKADRTIAAVRVAPVSVTGFVVGKSLIGVTNSLLVTVLCALAAGFPQAGLPQLLLIALCSSFISFVVGFLTGLSSDDFISAIASLKILMIPAVAPILAIELLGDKWQWPFYWSPFYWAYDGMKGVLAGTARWDRILMDAGLVIAISFAVYLASAPIIRKKLR